ncbi:MAG: OmpH family outer membrane protein [Sterolibacteriaceae bacterium]|uniref:OmpH family outer membrane protein n=1 Tax=Sulfuritalea sp. TaxID=2480090 RepID=UPI001A497D54|nr:OmpH family outer membrane protein [Sulfuritalea sp.]MBL8479441.1 OmpH family outer membrane protein [Sterolibacteriaceae bacterium]MBN8474687.1 OmpH family outer membrane protein [Sulfuritalea sp.]
MLKKYIIAAAILSLAANALAEGKIGFVNSQKILNDAPQAARAKKKIEKDFEKRDQDLQRIAKQLQGMQENLDKNAVTMAESERRNKEREFGDLNRDFQRKQREFREDLSQRQNEEMAAIFERVNKIIKQIAETEKYDIIFQEAVYANPRIDITDKVIKALGDGGK